MIGRISIKEICVGLLREIMMVIVYRLIEIHCMKQVWFLQENKLLQNIPVTRNYQKERFL